MYRACVEEDLALPVIAGEKPENERFPGADETWSIEAMMQDGKALQAGTSHYLGIEFRRPLSGIQFPEIAKAPQQHVPYDQLGHVSTRLVGGVVMTHGDDDGLRTPPRNCTASDHHFANVAKTMTRRRGRNAGLLRRIARQALPAFQDMLREPVRVLLDTKSGKAKRWDWVRKGAPIIVEVGPRDMKEGKVAVLRRDALWNMDNGKPAFRFIGRDEFAGEAAATLAEMQQAILAEASERRDQNITRGITTMDDLKAFYSSSAKYPGWVEVQWSKPTGEALNKVVEQLKSLKLTVRNVPRDGPAADGECIFTGEPAAERIYVARAY